MTNHRQSVLSHCTTLASSIRINHHRNRNLPSTASAPDIYQGGDTNNVLHRTRCQSKSPRVIVSSGSVGTKLSIHERLHIAYKSSGGVSSNFTHQGTFSPRNSTTDADTNLSSVEEPIQPASNLGKKGVPDHHHHHDNPNNANDINDAKTTHEQQSDNFQPEHQEIQRSQAQSKISETSHPEYKQIEGQSKNTGNDQLNKIEASSCTEYKVHRHYPKIPRRIISCPKQLSKPKPSKPTHSGKKSLYMKIKPRPYAKVLGSTMTPRSLFPTAKLPIYPNKYYNDKTHDEIPAQKHAKDFIRANALNSIRTPSKIPIPSIIDDWKGHRTPWCTSGRARYFVLKPDFGRVPNYLNHRKQQLGLNKNYHRNIFQDPDDGCIKFKNKDKAPSERQTLNFLQRQNFYHNVGQNPKTGYLPYERFSWNNLLNQKQEQPNKNISSKDAKNLRKELKPPISSLTSVSTTTSKSDKSSVRKVQSLVMDLRK